MPIECHHFHPNPYSATTMDNPGMSRLALSTLCHNLSPPPPLMSNSSRITSPNFTSSTYQQRSVSPASYSHHNCNSPAPSKHASLYESVSDRRLPPINHLHFPVHSHLHSYSGIPTRPVTHPNVVPQSINQPEKFSTSPREQFTALTKTRSHPQVDVVLPRPHNPSSQNPRRLARREISSQYQSSYAKRRTRSQTASRVCSNCGILQTRQWVRGENHSWLCHSCGQFWRKNNYPRPRALWNRPTFKRSSRKSKLGIMGSDGSRKYRSSTKQAVSSSFLNGKKMIQWEIRLPPIHQGSNPRRLT